MADDIKPKTKLKDVDVNVLAQNWAALSTAWVLLRNRKNHDNKIIVPIMECVKALLNQDEHWEVIQSFTDPHQIEVAKILYGKSKTY